MIRRRVDDGTRHHNLPYLYTAVMTAGLLVVGVLPGYLAYQVAFVDRGTLLVKHHQRKSEVVHAGDVGDAVARQTKRIGRYVAIAPGAL